MNIRKQIAPCKKYEPMFKIARLRMDHFANHQLNSLTVPEPESQISYDMNMIQKRSPHLIDSSLKYLPQNQPVKPVKEKERRYETKSVSLKPINNLCLQVYNPENSPSRLLKQFIYDFEPKLEELKHFSQTLKPQSRGIPQSSSQNYRVYKSQVE
ncbi:Hypothetical_protein [Hexamita inflata]|uniref:Hypothetical_protein n=1 Tax=Hexamita inflata TaxID=28002 RepID=A0AA86Q281_9EUKA|nr:Hypothetical protein HINF_LOCUS38226 [Hexamita inflata]